jgi:hypothetical protein
MMFIKYRILLASAVSMLALTACSSTDSASGTAPAKDTVAATVNGTPIGERIVGLMLKQRTDLGRTASSEARNGFIDRLAMQLVITQEAVEGIGQGARDIGQAGTEPAIDPGRSVRAGLPQEQSHQ